MVQWISMQEEDIYIFEGFEGFEGSIHHTHTLSLIQVLFPMNSMSKGKVVFILGATGTGKSKLAINLAAHFGGEVVNSDKIQLYHGLNVITNKATATECAGIPHHLIGVVPPSMDFSAADFRHTASLAVDSILARSRLPVIAGGSNSYIEELVDGNHSEFRHEHDCIFLWVDVDLPTLHAFLGERVHKMVEMGLVEEARAVFDPECSNYSKGIRKAIGVQEMDWYLRSEGATGEKERAEILAAAIDKIKVNTCKLACYQREKIRRLAAMEGWDVWQLDATEVFEKEGEEAEKAWESVVRESVKIVEGFLSGKKKGYDVNNDGIAKSLDIHNGTVTA